MKTDNGYGLRATVYLGVWITVAVVLVVAGEQVQITPLQLFIALAITFIDLSTYSRKQARND